MQRTTWWTQVPAKCLVPGRRIQYCHHSPLVQNVLGRGNALHPQICCLLSSWFGVGYRLSVYHERSAFHERSCISMWQWSHIIAATLERSNAIMGNYSVDDNSSGNTELQSAKFQIVLSMGYRQLCKNAIQPPHCRALALTKVAYVAHQSLRHSMCSM